MKKKLVTIGVICSALLCVMFGINRYSKYINMSTCQIKESFFSDDNIEQLGECYKKINKNIMINSYSITLKETAVDTAIGNGYAVVEYKKNNGSKKIKLGENPESLYEGIDNRFRLRGPIEERQFVCKNNIVYEYVRFSIEDDKNIVLQITDANEEDKSTKSGLKTYEFLIEHTSAAKIFDVDEKAKVYVSPIGVAVLSNKKIFEVEAVYKNKGIKELIHTYKKDGYVLGADYICGAYEGWEYNVKNIFDSVLDVKQVECIVFNGEKYTFDK